MIVIVIHNNPYNTWKFTPQLPPSQSQTTQHYSLHQQHFLTANATSQQHRRDVREHGTTNRSGRADDVRIFFIFPTKGVQSADTTLAFSGTVLHPVTS